MQTTQEQPITINKTITINGNDYLLNENGQTEIFNITGQNITLQNMILTEYKYPPISISNGTVTLTNLTYI